MADRVAGIPKWKTVDLEALARSRFGELSEAEQKLLRAAPLGEVTRCSPNDKDSDADNDPAKADGWGPERQIRAKIIRWLCVDREAAKIVDPRGISVHAAKVTGKLDLSFATVAFPLMLARCRLAEDADLTSAQIPSLSLEGSWTRSISADRVNVAGSVIFREGFTAEGEVRLLGAQIGSNLDCNGGTFKNPGGRALNADRVKVAGSVGLRARFTAEGDVRLSGAQIGSNLECNGGTFKNVGGRALSADGVNVAGFVFLRESFTAEGAVWLVGAQIGGNLECEDGMFSVLHLETAVIKGNFFWFKVPNAQGAKLNLTNASAGAIKDDKASWPKEGNLYLDGFTYGRISESPTDAKTRLEWLARLDPFRPQPYRQLAKVLRETGDDRGARQVLFEMERLRREKVERPPRDQMVREGQMGEKWGGLRRWWRWLLNRFWRLWSWVLKWTIGYGHRPGWAFWWLLGLAFAGFVLTGLGYLGGAMAPSNKEAYEHFEQFHQPPPYYPRFNAPIYSLEHSFPLVNLGQKEYWAPNPQGSGQVPSLEWKFLESLRHVNLDGVHPFRLPHPSILRMCLWLQVFLGWVLTTLFVAGLTGIVKSSD